MNQNPFFWGEMLRFKFPSHSLLVGLEAKFTRQVHVGVDFAFRISIAVIVVVSVPTPHNSRFSVNFCSQPIFAGNILIEDGVYPKQSMTKVGVATCVQTFLVISKILFVKMLFWIAQMVNMICACYLNIKHLNKISQYMKHGICILLVLALSTSHSSNCIPV